MRRRQELGHTVRRYLLYQFRVKEPRRNYLRCLAYQLATDRFILWLLYSEQHLNIHGKRQREWNNFAPQAKALRVNMPIFLLFFGPSCLNLWAMWDAGNSMSNCFCRHIVASSLMRPVALRPGSLTCIWDRPQWDNMEDESAHYSLSAIPVESLHHGNDTSEESTGSLGNRVGGSRPSSRGGRAQFVKYRASFRTLIPTAT